MDPSQLSTLLFRLARSHPGLPLRFVKALPLSLLHALRGIAFRRVVALAAERSAYYREEFARLGLDPRRIRRPEDLGEFFVTPELLKTRPEALLCGDPDLALESSGTTGQITRVYLSRGELEYNARQGLFLLALYGLGKGDRLLCTLDYGFGLGALLVERGLHYTGLFGMTAGRVDPEEAYRRLPVYSFNVIVSDPFWLLRLTEIARERGRPHPLKLMVGGGEGVTDRARSVLETFWEAPLCMTYASTEAATILGFECAHRGGYHVNEFDFFVEIDRPDADGYGEIVLTTVSRRVMPLIRYRTGDVARLHQEPCRCGLPFSRLSPLRGRTDEVVSCAWGNVHPRFFEDLLSEVPEIGLDWQVALIERDLKPIFQFRLESSDGAGKREEAVRLILEELERRHPHAWDAYRRRMVEIEFSFFEEGTLRQKRKLTRLVDERGSGSPAWVQEAIRS
jgi:phenylacetate-CoA ligase